MGRYPPFQVLGPSHQAILAGSVLLAVALVLWLRRSPDPDRGRRVLPALGVLVLLGETLFCVWPWFEGSFSVRWSLPLQLCDLAALLCLPALVTRHPLLVELVYFWGFSGTLLATLTPDLVWDAPHPEFFGFFASHALVVVAAACLVYGLRIRPRPGSWLRVFGLIQLYGLGIAALNASIRSNYLYLCKKPGVDSPFDFLGPWPLYVLAVDGILLALLAVLGWLSRIDSGLSDGSGDAR